MINKKLISIRLQADTLAMVEKVAAEQDYRTRSSVIEAVLQNVLQCADPDALFRIVDTKHAYDKGYVTRFDKDRDTMTRRAADAIRKDD